MGPEDGAGPAKPVVTEAPNEKAQYIASPECCMDQCWYPVLIIYPVILYNIIITDYRSTAQLATSLTMFGNRTELSYLTRLALTRSYGGTENNKI